MNNGGPAVPGPIRQRVIGAEIDDALQRIAARVTQSQAAGLLPRLPWDLGLGAAEQRAVRARWPSAAATWYRGDATQPLSESPTADDPSGLLPPLHDLLLSHRRASTDPLPTVFANLLTSACFGNHHLWQDLGASGRDEVSGLMAWAFPALHASNHRDLRWKRHLFMVVGERLERIDLRPPKCDACDHFGSCFGADAPLVAARVARTIAVRFADNDVHPSHRPDTSP